MEITGRAVIADPTTVYGLMRVPNMQRYDEMDAVFWSSAFASQGVVIEPFTRCLILQPYPLQSPTLPGQWQFGRTGSGAGGAGPDDTGGAWRQALDAATALPVIEMPDSTPGRRFSATSAWDVDESSSFYLNLYREEQARDAARSPDSLYTQVSLADGVPGGLRLTLAFGQPPVLELNTGPNADGTTRWAEVSRARDVDDCAKYLALRADKTYRLRVLCLPSEGAVVLTLGQGDATLALRLDGYTLPAGPLTVSGMNGAVRVQFLPLRFVPLGSIISDVRDNGLAIVNAPQAQADAVQGPGATVTVEGEILLGNSYRYAVTLDGSASADASGLATATPLVRSVTIFFPGQSYTGTSVRETYLNLRRVREQLTFPLETLCYEQMAWLTCDNRDARWTGASGYRACYLEAGIDGDNWRRLTGWIGGVQQSRQDPVRETTFLLYGKEHWLRRKSVGVIPPFDGWDIYGAIRFLAQLGGVTDDFLIGLPYAPPGRGSDTPYFHLPLGTGALGARFQFDPRTRIWDAMRQLARLVQGYLAFDVFGFLVFRRWAPTALGGYYQAFDVVPDDYGGVPLLNQVKGTLAATVDLSDVRSDIVLGSIDPFTFLPVFAHWHNESVVTDTSDPAFLGNTDAEIEINSLLFDPGLQDEVIGALSYQASLPTLTAGLEGYFQRQLLPLNVITATDGFCLGGLYPFYVTAMMSEYGVDRRASFGASRINGRWLENL